MKNLDLNMLSPFAANDDRETFTPKGVCSKLIRFAVEDGKVRNVAFTGGCDGNLKGIAKLVEGMDAEEVIEKLQGITCGKKATSCPDQFSIALREYLNNH
ncbi:TIGR03905 family TSCPD domain-containing protein [Pseudodesulfovibrio tunisiensis]|uniref:TIGR03905 family TSCPD domain-containing protein n=1 Tax=Pseudodesulfovibrio tunisiensis TaxID=463192 RepID=UPI001FB4C3F5|nr:TIGR03905 family TSCPD domain-containing protein [Pseudodesulfovibrio tunisiensis]